MGYPFARPRFVLATRKAERRLNARKLAAWGASELVLDRGSSPDRARAMRSAGRVSSQSGRPVAVVNWQGGFQADK